MAVPFRAATHNIMCCHVPSIYTNFTIWEHVLVHIRALILRQVEKSLHKTPPSQKVPRVLQLRRQESQLDHVDRMVSRVYFGLGPFAVCGGYIIVPLLFLLFLRLFLPGLIGAIRREWIKAGSPPPPPPPPPPPSLPPPPPQPQNCCRDE